MYRDVKKKLLSVALCICMIIGMVQIVPKAKAATTTEISGWVNGGSGSTTTYKVQVSTGSAIVYDGNAHYANLDSIDPMPSNARCGLYYKDASGKEVAAPTDAGTYNIYVRDEDGTYSFDETVVGTLTIDQATIQKVDFMASPEINLIKGSEGTIPKLLYSKLTTTTGQNIKLAYDATNGYTIAPITTSGEKDYLITFADNVKKNFTNADTILSNQTVRCTAAYDIGSYSKYQVVFKNGDTYSQKGQGSYQQTAFQPEVAIRNTTDNSIVGTIPSSKITYTRNGVSGNSVRYAGDYKVQIDLGSATESESEKIGSEYFSGSCTTEDYHVTGMSVKNFYVYVTQDGKKFDINPAHSGNDDYKALIMDWAEGEAVEPNVTLVETENHETVSPSSYSISFTNNTNVGTAKIKISIATDKYEGDLEIPYSIASDLRFQTIKFSGGYVFNNEDVIELPYTGSVRLPTQNKGSSLNDGIEIINANEGGRTLIEGADSHYEVYYSYQTGVDSSTKEPIFANKMTRAQAAASEEMKKPGTKKIIVEGRGMYAGRTLEKTYEIMKVNMEEQSSKFTLSIVSEDKIYYNGQEQKPTVNVTYAYDTNNTVTLNAEDFTATYKNNINVGSKAQVTITATENSGFEGSLTADFKIKPVDISNAKIENAPFTYSGKPVVPQIVIQGGIYGSEYKFSMERGVDYDIVDAEGNEITEALPTDASDDNYQLIIRNNHIADGNITGTKKTLVYKINRKNIAEVGFVLKGTNGENREIEWNGGETKPDLESNLSLDDYSAEYHCGTDLIGVVSGASVHIVGKGNYSQDTTLHYTIMPRKFTSGSNSDFVCSTSFSGNVPSASGYQIKLSVKDTARTPETAQTLRFGTDYEIQSVSYSDGTNNEFSELEFETDYQINNTTNEITSLKKAGKYRITIVGKGIYDATSTLQVVQNCGKDISSLWAHINQVSERSFVFKKETEQKPTDFSLYDKSGNKQTSISYDNGSKEDSDFWIDYERLDNGIPINTASGRIYVVAVGNPERGYFGRTSRDESKAHYYDIVPPTWTEENLKITVAEESGITYQPLGGTRIPKITVLFNGDELIEDEDYRLVTNRDTGTYDKEILRTAGKKTIYVDGIGDFESQTNKNRIVQYTVAPVDVAIVDSDSKPTDYTDIHAGSITLTYSGYTLVEGKDKDYTKSIKYDSEGNAVVKGPDNNYYITYIVKGLGNYCGEKEVPVLVNKVSFDGGQFASSEKEAAVGQFYVEWQKSEQIIKDPSVDENKRVPVNPSAFKIGYKRTATDSVPLTKGVDYVILEKRYGTNQKAGNDTSNYVTIQGMGGYEGEATLRFTLYTQIKDAEPAETSLIKEGEKITKSDWKKLYESKGEAGLLKLKKLSFDEVDYIDPSEYSLDWTPVLDLANPAAGNYSVTVTGLQKESHYYYDSTKPINFTIVDGIDDAEITIGKNNTVTYKGASNPVLVTASGIGIRVVVDGNDLVCDTDYRITGYSGNNEIGTATVFLEGIGKYSGKAQADFLVTYPINSLVVFMRNPKDDSWVNCATDTVDFKYTGNPIEPDIKLYCPLDKPDGVDYLDVEPIPESLYGAVTYVNNTDAGKGSVVINGGKFFTDGSANPQRSVNFSIVAASICPPAKGGTVNYKSSIYSSVENIVAEYVGESYTADDLGITLNDHGQDLTVPNDYLVYSDGDTLNVSQDDPLSWPMLTFTGAGNYKGSEHKIQFRIVQKDIADTSVTVETVEQTYSDSALEQQIISKMSVVMKTPKGRELPLVYGTDFEIEKYYTDAACNRPVSAATGILNELETYYIPSAQGTYYARIQGINNFKGNRVIQINITKKDLTGDIKIHFVSSEDSDCLVNAYGEPECVYDGSQHRPAIEVTYGIDNIRLQEERDYTVSYGENKDAGASASVTVHMIVGSNYTGEETRTFTIKPKSISGADMEFRDINGNIFKDEQGYAWTGDADKPVRPDVTIIDRSLNAKLAPSTNEIVEDYKVTYHDDNGDNEEDLLRDKQVNAGEVTMTIEGQGNYTGTKTYTYYIGEDISKSYTLVNGKKSLSTEYNGLVQAPQESSISVVWGGSTGAEDASGAKRYDIAYYKDGFAKSNIVTSNQIVNAGTYYVAVVGVPSKGTYAKSSEDNSCIYTITPRSIAPSYILVSGYDGSYYYTGQAIEPKGIAVEDTDLPVPDQGNDAQRRSVQLTNDIDFDLSYANNVSAGKASIIVTGKGNYTGSRVAYFNIVSSAVDGNNTWDGSSEGTGSISNGTTTIAAADIQLGYDNSAYNCMMYNGYERIPTVTINGKSSNDFIITASNNIRPGVATLTITGRGNNFTGTIIKTYKIKADLSTYGTITTIADQVYSGYQITPHVTVTCGGNLLNQGSDFTVSYLNNVNVGRATVMATAASDSYYIGTVTGGFNISNTAGGMEISGYASSYTYTGYAITPDIVVMMNGKVLNRGTDYVVSYSNNTNAGTATMTVTGIGGYSGTKKINFTIEAKNIENCLTTSVTTNYQYTGNTYTPNVTVTDSSNGKTLVAGTDYTVTYSNNTNPGTASVTVTALSKNYTGSKVIPFKITSAAVSGLRTSAIKNNSMKLSWSKQDYADGYQICNSSNRVVAATSKNSYTVTGLNSCTTYKFKVRSYVENSDGSVSYGNFSTAVSAKTLLNTPKLTAKSTSKGKVTLTWTKVSKATGYEIFYSTKKNGSYRRLKTISKSSSRKYVDSGLASGEKYYYTIRAYRTTNGVKTYSNYNTIKSVKVK